MLNLDMALIPLPKSWPANKYCSPLMAVGKPQPAILFSYPGQNEYVMETFTN